LSELVHIYGHVHTREHVCLCSSLWDTLRAAHHEPWRHRSLQLLLLSEGVDKATNWLLLLLLLLREALVVEGVEGLVLVGHHLRVTLRWLESWVLVVQAH
jgi:hypothetical protein